MKALLYTFLAMGAGILVALAAKVFIVGLATVINGGF